MINKANNWYSILKVAGDHGDTMRGQMLRQEATRLARTIGKLRGLAAGNELDGVLPRWRGEVRRSILLLPTADKVAGMSMWEIEGLSRRVESILGVARRYSSRRLAEILGNS